MKDTYTIAVVHGDGIGPEVARAAVAVLQAGVQAGTLRFVDYPAGADHFLKTGDSFPAASFEGCRTADAILHGAAGIPGVVHPDGTEAGLDFTLTLRFKLDLFANVRPIKLYKGVPSPLGRPGPIDYVIVRENSEGLYAARGAGALLREEVAVDTLVQTRKGVERIVRFAFELARTRNGSPKDGRRRVTCCDKANVLRTYAFFRAVFDEVAKEYPDIEAEHVLVDAMTVHLVNKPTHFDVIVTENMFGDIISDLGAATVGGMGMAPSEEVGDGIGFFQASHGSAPDIAGKGLANPYGTILASILMLRRLDQRHRDSRLKLGADRIEAAVCAGLEDPALRTRDIGGVAPTNQVVDALLKRL
ncbi:isocitrate/isopropylmalate dehydrogenase family protein [Bradyrhizobium diazoefficiens]|uniref:3-isopropylmalate dehydrogenase n=2 Tax=Bradyrhizobium diazoefficiens TaxID=1355477 RepID=Q89GM4_BRADU|nr:isocitrate/isopropylmalate dehydrogenase family protein [Bradyrhizobium diazoefficiens]AND91413.1 3-isopropylmalate dehydrogenase [Bradyrhizobium diazoefficiens USDA 110]QBP25076.1 isocitrate/isopropylmalate dehydrogenase family protein [Bradyrhizobium diazoefficiens]QLD41961.1 isocitrate/isopropylmalate dehydrogenase family protein [Bradyrhizobium diazoefficiens]WLB36486.1 isocitrate/isopropylmalate dehydrogenase family protein [Bradyrhizobium diazoefficiens]WLC18513.1 isocitrate/isopropyl